MLSIKQILVAGHSEMRCAKYDTATGKCYAPIRNQGVAYLQEAYSFYNGAAICQSPMTNPISSSYGNGAGCPDYAPCPDQMGNFSAGETFTVMWFARNHAVADQSPATVFLYLSPKETANQGADVSQAVMESNKICQGPYMNCNGQNGDTVPCTLTCTMPSSLSTGIYTMWWKWIWQNGAMYATCADINVKISSSTPSPPPSITTGKPLVTTGKAPITTGKAAVTTGKVPVTTGKASVTTGRISVSTGKTVGSFTTGSASPITTGIAASTSGSVDTPCTSGEMKCVTSESYQMCARGVWASPQYCNVGLTCHPSGQYVYCY